MPYIGVSPQFGVRKKHTYTATAGQTSFSGAGSEGVTLSYKDSNFVDVYQNGVKLGDADYTSTSGTAIVLAQGASVDDLVEIIVFDVFSISDTVSKADGGTFDGNVTMGGTLAVTGTTALTGNATAAGTLGVTGATTLSNTLGVTGASTLTGALSAKGGAVFNEDAADVDFRVESSNDPNLLVVDGGSDFVSIGESSQVNGGKLSIATSAASAILSLLSRSTTDSDEAFIVLQKSSTNSGNFAATVDGEALGSIKFRGVNTSAVSDIGAEINVVQNGTSSTSVPTDIKIRTNEAERMVITSTTGLIKYNNAFVYYFKGSVLNNASVSIDVPDISSAGATMVHAFYTHHAIQNYGAARVSTLGMYLGSVVSTHDIQNVTSSGGGSWSYSSPGSNVLRITKNAGTYIGGGNYVVKVETYAGPS